MDTTYSIMRRTCLLAVADWFIYVYGWYWQLILYLYYAVHPLNKLPYSKLDSKAIGIKNGVIFVTYSSLIASSEKGRSRLQQLVQWCGHEFDGLLVFDEVMYSISVIIIW